jgi:hypothetical protein
MFRSVNVDAFTIILGAYRTADRRLFRSQVIGAPAWLAAERYDITAKVGAELAALPRGEGARRRLPIRHVSRMELIARGHVDRMAMPVDDGGRDGQVGHRRRRTCGTAAAGYNERADCGDDDDQRRVSLQSDD